MFSSYVAESHNEKSTRILKHKIYFKGGNSEAKNGNDSSK